MSDNASAPIRPAEYSFNEQKSEETANMKEFPRISRGSLLEFMVYGPWGKSIFFMRKCGHRSTVETARIWSHIWNPGYATHLLSNLWPKI